ncbi:MAG: DUF1304 domain-containing protein [Elusimicrobia bacterium]|nr:DUF1304 domain-containing protein [Elusimicrobiota bacterium]
MTLRALAVGAVAVLHLGFFVLEAYFWDKPLGLRVFHLTPEFAQASRVLAANQGLYNGFLAAGLLWGLYGKNASVQIFFLGCVVVAGLFGAATVGRSILFVQALPGAAALALVLLTP